MNWKEKYGEQAFELRINHDPRLYRDYTPLEWEAMMRDLQKKSTEYMEVCAPSASFLVRGSPPLLGASADDAPRRPSCRCAKR